jgi:hypothetical protein
MGLMRALRFFALKLIPLFAVSGYLIYRQNPPVAYAWVGFGLALILAGMVWPRLLWPLQRGLEWLGAALRRLMTRILLEGIYLLIVTPLAWFARRIGKTFLDLTTAPDAPSYFIRRGKDSTPGNYEKGW